MIDIFEHSKVFVPINISGTHWVLAVINITEHTINYYDSLGSDGSRYLEVLLRYIQAEHIRKKQQPLQENEWALHSHDGSEIPQQDNNCDCGVFTLVYADYITDNLPLTFEQKDIADFRLKIYHSIQSGKLWYSEQLVHTIE